MTSQSDDDSSDEDDIEDSNIDDDALLSDDDGLSLSPGERPIAGQDWTLVKILGKPSGFGEVWLAKDEAMDSWGAFKFCKDPNKSGTIKSLHNEVDKLRAIKHDGIVRLVAANLRAKPPFLQYEYFEDSCDLRQVLEDYPNQFGASVDPEDACYAILSLAETLAFCHSSKPPLIHRDLKPANILVLDYGLLELAQAMGLPPRLSGLQFKLLDFGIATRARSESDETQHQQSLGRDFDGFATREYASPQQRFGGEDYRPCPSDDIYSLGVIWWQLVTGETPRRTDTPESLQDKLKDVRLPATIKTILRRCLASSPEKRIPNATKLVELLGGGLGERRLPVSEVLEKAFKDGIEEACWPFGRFTCDLDQVKILSRRCADFIMRHMTDTEHLRLNGLKYLSVETAEVLVKIKCPIELGGLNNLPVELARALGRSLARRPCYNLDGLEELGTEAAEALFGRPSCITLNGLQCISPQMLRFLVEHSWDNEIELNGLKELSIETATALTSMPIEQAELKCKGVTEITPEVAKVLSEVTYDLELTLGLKTLSPDVAEALKGLNGLHLQLTSLEELAPETLTCLRRTLWGNKNLTGGVTLYPKTISAAAIKQLAIGSYRDYAPNIRSLVRLYTHYICDINADVAMALRDWHNRDHCPQKRLDLRSLMLADLSLKVVEALAGYKGVLVLADFEDEAVKLPNAVRELWLRSTPNTAAHKKSADDSE